MTTQPIDRHMSADDAREGAARATRACVGALVFTDRAESRRETPVRRDEVTATRKAGGRSGWAGASGASGA